MSAFKKELIKVLALLGLGIVLLIIFMIKGNLGISSFFAGWQEMVVGLAIPCYPIGIVYGGGDMWRFFYGNAGKEHYTEEEFEDMSKRDLKNAHREKLMIVIFFLAATIMFGWIFGVYKACKKLYMLRNKIYV